MSRRSAQLRSTPAARSEAADAAQTAGADATVSFALVVAVALALCAFMKVPSLYYPLSEADERIYWQLAENLALKGSYTLQGSPLATALSPGIYDHPLFHHPPLFAAMLAPFVTLGAKSASVLVSWLGHLLAVLAVALVGWHVMRRRSESEAGWSSPVFWLPLLGVCADPLLSFISRRLWIDSLLSGLVALAMALLLVAGGPRRRVWLAASGTLLGLAALAKLSALLVAPVYLWAVYRGDSTWRGRLASSAAAFAPVGLLVVPWCVLFYVRCGVFVPPWVKPDAALIQQSAFVKLTVGRPWYYYLLKLPLLSPVVLVCGWVLARSRADWRDLGVQVGAAWFAIVLAALTLLGIDGYGFQMRHVAPAVAAMYVLLLFVLAQRERPGAATAAAFTLLPGAVTGAMYLLSPQYDEITSLVEIAQLVRF